MKLIDQEKFYQNYSNKISAVKKILSRPLTLSEKILYSHMEKIDQSIVSLKKGEVVKFYPDRVVMQDATAQMAMLQFMSSGRKTAAVPSSIHCDHLIQARDGANKDLLRAVDENQEVYDFLESASSKYDIDFWKPGAGIIHQVVIENYALPGTMILGTDSHTPNAGGLTTVAIGVGGADAADVMAGLTWSVSLPKLIGVKLTGKLSGWTSAKDVILKLAGILTVKGGTGCIIEYFGEGVSSISLTGRGTITNMGAELGATTSVFPYDERSANFQRATERAVDADVCLKYLKDLNADDDVLTAPQNYFDQIIEIDLSTLEPHVVGPHTPDLARPISKLKEEVIKNGYPDQIRVSLIGSCTNSSYEDIGRSANVAKQGLEKGIKSKTYFMITPGSEAVFETIKQAGYLDTLNEAGGVVLANACGPCIGQWDRKDIKKGEVNTIVTSFNRNFKQRNDGNADTMAFIASPEIVTAFALSGSLSFNPLTDKIKLDNGTEIKLTPPEAEELPKTGLKMVRNGLVEPKGEGEVVVNPKSERLALLDPFPKWDGEDINDSFLLVKVKGKCTTDAISPAGPWLKFRGHLDRISDNLLTGAVDAFTGETGVTLNLISKQREGTSAVARKYREAKKDFIIIGDENYGEGSSREHAAMSPRYFGGRAVIARSFARIHETNLKKQGMLALKFKDIADYEKIREGDLISVQGLKSLAPNKDLTIQLKHSDGSVETFLVTHGMTDEQIKWFKAGSALNTMRD